MGDWHKKRMKCERSGRSILQSTFVFDEIRRGNYFGGMLIGRVEVDVRVGKVKNGKAAGGDEITGEMIKGGGDWVVDWI